MLTRISGEVGTRLDGIIGTDLFAQGKLTIDYPNGRVWIDRQADGDCPG